MLTAQWTATRYHSKLKGYALTHKVDYEETFAPVAKMTSIVRIVIALTTTKGWHLHQMDVKNTFLQGELEEEFFIIQLPGFESTKRPTAVYRLKQAPRAWHSKITQLPHVEIG